MFNLPNILTVVRIILVPVFAVLIFQRSWGTYLAALIVFCVAAYTDRLDGKLARKYGIVTNFGKIADPFADKALMLTAFVILSLVQGLFWWFTIGVAIREIAVTLLRFVLLRRGKVLPASMGGKLKTSLQMLLVVMMMTAVLVEGHNRVLDLTLSWLALGVLLVAFTVTIITGLLYFTDAYSENRKARQAAAEALQPAPALAGEPLAMPALADTDRGVVVEPAPAPAPTLPATAPAPLPDHPHMSPGVAQLQPAPDVAQPQAAPQFAPHVPQRDLPATERSQEHPPVHDYTTDPRRPQGVPAPSPRSGEAAPAPAPTVSGQPDYTVEQLQARLRVLEAKLNEAAQASQVPAGGRSQQPEVPAAPVSRTPGAAPASRPGSADDAAPMRPDPQVWDQRTGQFEQTPVPVWQQHQRPAAAKLASRNAAAASPTQPEAPKADLPPIAERIQRPAPSAPTARPEGERPAGRLPVRTTQSGIPAVRAEGQQSQRQPAPASPVRPDPAPATRPAEGQMSQLEQRLRRQEAELRRREAEIAERERHLALRAQQLRRPADSPAGPDPRVHTDAVSATGRSDIAASRSSEQTSTPSPTAAGPAASPASRDTKTRLGRIQFPPRTTGQLPAQATPSPDALGKRDEGELRQPGRRSETGQQRRVAAEGRNPAQARAEVGQDMVPVVPDGRLPEVIPGQPYPYGYNPAMPLGQPVPGYQMPAVQPYGYPPYGQQPLSYQGYAEQGAGAVGPQGNYGYQGYPAYPPQFGYQQPGQYGQPPMGQPQPAYPPYQPYQDARGEAPAEFSQNGEQAAAAGQHLPYRQPAGPGADPRAAQGYYEQPGANQHYPGAGQAPADHQPQGRAPQRLEGAGSQPTYPDHFPDEFDDSGQQGREGAAREGKKRKWWNR